MTLRPARRPISDKLVALSPLLFALFIGALVTIALIVNRNFWFDESMAFQAVGGESLLAPGIPMELYEQAMPYGVYLIFKAQVSAFGLNENVLRIPGLLAYFVGLIALYRASRIIQTSVGRLAALFAGGLGIWVVTEATEFKHYIFEFAAAGIILAAGCSITTRQFSSASMRTFMICSIISLPFSNTAIFMTSATALAALYVVYRLDLAALVRARGLLLASAAVYLTAFACIYFLVIRPAAGYQLSLTYYKDAGFGSFFTAILGIYAPTGRDIYLVFGAMIFLVILIGAFLSRSSGAISWTPYLMLGLLLAAMAVAGIVGLAPFNRPRHVVFAVPAIGLAFGSAFDEIRSRIAANLIRTKLSTYILNLVVAAVAAGFMGIAIMGASNRHEQVGVVLAASDAECGKTYVAYSYQPAAEIYRDRDNLGIELEGTVSPDSGFGSNSWIDRVRDNMPAYQARAVSYFQRNGPGCLLSGPVAATDDIVIPLESAGIQCSVLRRDAGVGIYWCG